MELMVPLPAGDFCFDSTDSFPLSPQGFNCFFNAPLSGPSNYYFDHDCGKKYSDDEAFTFSIGGDLNLPALPSADELFDSGKIKPCEPDRKKIIRNTLSFGRNNKVCSKHLTAIIKGSSAKRKKNERAVVALSAHERHYKMKRAAAEEMRKRTYLPYKQNLMIGCVDLAAAGVSDPSESFYNTGR